MKARSGQALVEYLLVIALVAITLIAALAYLRSSMGDTLEKTSELDGYAPAGSAPNAPAPGDCATPGNGAPAPGKGGTPPGPCQKGSK